ncbi:MAG: RbsD/FucU domain-containing protein [Tepidisphaeraceae bacterium]|jgi:L-fucose mutarotase
MLKGQLLHPQILSALAKSGHGAKVLLSDGNFPHWTKRGANSEVVYLNLSPGMLTVPEVLKALIGTIPVEAAQIMDTNKTGPYTMTKDPEIWGEFQQILRSTDCKGELSKLDRFAFYDAAAAADVCLTIATGEQRIYANLLLTIGVVR